MPTIPSVSDAPSTPTGEASPTVRLSDQTILRLPDGVVLDRVVSTPLSPALLRALQRLAELVAQLRSPQQGWPATLAPTPENLLPYVGEEVDDVLEALEAGRISYPGMEALPQTTSQPCLVRVADLIPRLLWYMARSGYSIMQLIEGIRVRVAYPGEAWQSGMVRLAIVLAGTSPQRQWAFDLATQELPGNTLAPEAITQSDDNPLCQQPTAIADLQHFLAEQIRQATPGVEPLLQGLAVDWLEPGAGWVSGQLQLHLGLEFIPIAWDAPQPVEDLAEAVPVELVELAWQPTTHLRVSPELPPPTAEPVSHAIPDPAPEADSAQSGVLIRLTDAVILERYSQLASHQQLAAAFAPSVNPTATDLPAPLALAQQACDAADRLERLPQTSGFGLLQPELLMDELLPKLLWHITRSSYEIMRLVGGVEANLLQPQHDWQQGILRLLVQLQVTAANQNWAIDLAQGQFLAAEPGWADGLGVVQSNETVLCHQPTEIATLSETVLNQIWQTTPELQLLATQTSVELLADGLDWQPATLQLRLGLEFLSGSECIPMPF